MIDQLKNHGLTHSEISNHEFDHKTNGKLSLIYRMYQERLKNYNSVDFGDLIMLPLEILKKKKNYFSIIKKNLNTYLWMNIKILMLHNICC